MLHLFLLLAVILLNYTLYRLTRFIKKVLDNQNLATYTLLTGKRLRPPSEQRSPPMKVQCPACGKFVPRKRLQIVEGLWLRGKLARCCQDCAEKPDEQHQIEYEAEYGKVEVDVYKE